MGADVDAITTTMVGHAAAIDETVLDLRAQAAGVVTQARREADEHMVRARRTAEDLVTKAEVAAKELKGQADAAEETAAHWRRMAYAERHAAELPPLNASTPPGDEELTSWTGPDGRVWDLEIHYTDSSDARWHWAGGYETADGVEWPLMSRDDYAVVNVPLLKCPALKPVKDDAERTSAQPTGGA